MLKHLNRSEIIYNITDKTSISIHNIKRQNHIKLLQVQRVSDIALPNSCNFCHSVTFFAHFLSTDFGENEAKIYSANKHT